MTLIQRELRAATSDYRDARSALVNTNYLPRGMMLRKETKAGRWQTSTVPAHV